MLLLPRYCRCSCVTTLQFKRAEHSERRAIAPSMACGAAELYQCEPFCARCSRASPGGYHSRGTSRDRDFDQTFAGHQRDRTHCRSSSSQGNSRRRHASRPRTCGKSERSGFTRSAGSDRNPIFVWSTCEQCRACPAQGMDAKDRSGPITYRKPRSAKTGARQNFKTSGEQKQVRVRVTLAKDILAAGRCLLPSPPPFLV